ncbi:hypothetical protein F3Y22_tig00111582pilonHSYRG01203 [Hibiscus syriacus]|uniref:C3H1-type domain-containing protein n=1 Tax=Hibiscus syriacus TaxID=106335 RepID=A0A6A2YJR9_HIBSY|nr:hypothetical protein F3Y22_tig00111582pilonHSYRG01203 [Hibiscus syriacus]
MRKQLKSWRGSHKQNGVPLKFSDLLELSASDDLIGFKFAVEEGGHDINEPCLWYGRRIGCGELHRQKWSCDVNKAYGSDGTRALHCVAAGDSSYHLRLFQLQKKILEGLLKGSGSIGERDGLPAQVATEVKGYEQQTDSTPQPWKDENEKKDYPYNLYLPNIKNEIYETDEFRMYTFTVQPCSRAYSHDWTECPFVHPGENARRCDPRRYLYNCVPCPEFRKGLCKQGDNCEYAHGIFKSWLHPAQYRTRLCKDETNCTRKVCFFAHNPKELRPLYASTGSALPSPTSYAISLDHGSMSPLDPVSPSFIKPSTSTPLLTPIGTSSICVGVCLNQSSNIPPTLQLPSSRLKAAQSARASVSNLKQTPGVVGCPTVNRHSWYSTPASPVGTILPSVIEHPTINPHSGYSTPTSPVGAMPPNLLDWCYPDGKLDWGIQGEELKILRKSSHLLF